MRAIDGGATDTSGTSQPPTSDQKPTGSRQEEPPAAATEKNSEVVTETTTGEEDAKPALLRPKYAARRHPPKELATLAPDPLFVPKLIDPPASSQSVPLAGPAKIEKRHWGILATFLLVVALPIMVSAAYLWGVARDQYGSTVAFSIRKEEFQSSLDILGGISKLSGGGNTDSDVLYEYIYSQEMVENISKKLDLSRIYAKGWPQDPVFAYDPSGTIEDLMRHWERMVGMTYESSTGLMTLEVLAFDPKDATDIANAILDESTRMINALSEESRKDATRYAGNELAHSVDRLKKARGDLTAFRLRNKIVDPSADLQGQMGVLNSLQAQLADSLVELDLLRGSAREDDPRVQQASKRIEAIQSRLASEREKFGEGGKGPSGEDYATLVAEFERLTVDREFAEQTYRAALVHYDASVAEAQRKSRYLAAHIQPTKAERSDFPKRWTLLGIVGFFVLMAWSIAILIFYSVRDRR